MKRHCSHLTIKNTNVSPFGSQNRHEEEIGRFVVDFVQNPDRQTSLVAETDCSMPVAGKRFQFFSLSFPQFKKMGEY
jgi:hypothetical protein